MTESEFFMVISQALSMIEVQVEEANIGVDTSLSDGILELTFLDESKIIINRHLVNREIWVAAKRGGFHYQYDGRVWHNTRTGTPLLIELAEEISSQAKTDFSFFKTK